ncbi:MAG: galactose ABC transporter substrate-binding protein [Clostridiales bacterium]|jgi:methyl-galactoside transport system substrate-binding protein|nr:galactose ABC transporter substrate-binding protein [Clostridiales bacterium]
MKKAAALILSALMLGSTMTACSSSAATSSAAGGTGTQSASNVSVGVCVYKFDDTFMTGVRNNMTTRAQSLGCKLEIVDSQNSQPTQNTQVDTFITKGVNVLAVNPVDRTAAESLVGKAQAKNMPIVFLNREPEATVMQSYDKVWYVGAKAEQSGTLSGQLIADYFKKNKDTADKNHDGKVQYVMLEGEPGHQDATLRSKAAPQAIKDAGLEPVQLAAGTAMWDKAKATDLMNNFITSQGLDKIEAVLANNDDMALGAIEALKAKGYNKGDKTKYIPVVGVDASAPALEAMKEGSMLGTVLNDAESQGKATVNIAVAAAQGKKIDKSTVGYDVTDGKYVWIPYVQVTQDNYAKFIK